jgi:GT2 family glycosyltransferase
MIEITVCICTHNRSGMLAQCLAGLARQESLENALILVVANNCSDDTVRVAHSFEPVIPDLRVIEDSVPGLSHARNQGLMQTDTPYIAYLDDDAIPEPGWLSSLLVAFRASDAQAIGGKITPVWQTRTPIWMSASFYPLLGGVDLGDGTFVPDSYFCPVGANMAFRTETLRKVGGFDERYGICTMDGRETNRYRGDDTDIGIRLAQMNVRSVYCGAAAVSHYSHGLHTGLRNIFRLALQQGSTLGVFENFDTKKCGDELVWAMACMVSCVLRLHWRNALVFYFLTIERGAALREHYRSRGERFSLGLGLIQAARRMQRGLLGIAKRTLIGKPIKPWGN